VTGKPKFDATINLGHVLTMASFLLGGAAAYVSIQVSLTELQVDLKHFGGRMERIERENDSLSDRVRALETRN